MCGIIGCINYLKSLKKEQLIAATKMLHHRGPEELNIWQSKDGAVGLGHTRLAIIDICGGHQPLVSQDETIRVVVNGEFYEYEEIRNDLIAKGYSFRTHSDSEILIALYQECGINCLSYLRGEFAFILWDENKKLIFAGRDRFGIKPLFFSKYKGGLYLASEMKALFKLGIPAVWNENGVLSMMYLVPPQDLTIFKDIFSIKPGYFLIAKGGSNIRFEKYWDLNFDKISELPTKYNEADYIETFREKLEYAVKIRLKADVPVGCYLSGGLDSSVILALAAKIHHKPVKAFTIVFDDPLYDEGKYAKEMAMFTGADYHEIKITHKDIAENFSDTIWHSEYPIDNPHAVAEYLLSKFVSSFKFKVVLTGEGGDELLAGYDIFKEDLINYELLISTEEKQKLVAFLRESIVGSAYHPCSETDIKGYADFKRILGYIPTQFRSGALWGGRMYELYTDKFQSKIKNKNVMKSFIRSLDKSQIIGRNILNKSLYIYNKSVFPGYTLDVEGDRAQMSHSIEGRLPFLDHHLYEFTRHLPIEMKIKGTIEKYILREAAKDLLTKKTYERIKHPFYVPPCSDLTDKNMLFLMREVFNSNILNEIPFFDKKKVLKLLENFPSMLCKEMIIADSLLVAILSLCFLKERFNIAA